MVYFFGGVVLNYDSIVNGLNKIGSVLSVKINPDGTFGDICLEAANDIYLQSIHLKREDFVPGQLYSKFVPADQNYEAMSYRCIKENRMIHSYINAGQYNAWMEVYMLPLKSDEPDKGYYLFSYDMTPMLDAEKLSDLSPDVATKVIQTTIKLRENDDFYQAMNAIARDIRIDCGANRLCILLTDFKNRHCSVLSENVDDSENGIKTVSDYIEDGFINIVETWDDLINQSNCYIIHDAEELEFLKDKNLIWYESLKDAGVYSLVIYPLKANGENIGYIWATNFDSSDTLKIKSILEITSFILAAEIANHQMFRKMKILSDSDLLTGLYNRNAMNNRITDIVSGVNPLTDKYGVIFADLNGLKAVNDNEGHIAGDNLLKAAASVLRDTFTDSDIFRVGGDEFLILVTKHDEDEFNQLVQKLRDNSNATDIVRLAIGTCYGEPTLDIRTAMHLADERMYQDKEEYYKKHPELQYRKNEKNN